MRAPRPLRRVSAAVRSWLGIPEVLQIIARLEREARQELARQRAEFDIALDRTRSLEARATTQHRESSAAIERLVEQLAAADSELALERQRREALATELDIVLDRVRALELQRGELAERVGTTHDVIVGAMAAARARADAPCRHLLLVTPQRSGSTRLFDVLRAHPDVEMDPLARVWERLGIEGRRYPVALGDLDGATEAVVTGDGHASLIPAAHRVGPPRAEPWFVEKLHPQFFDFDADAFERNLAQLETGGHELVVLYGLRDPLASMWSMVDYRQRDPRWYAFLDVSEIPGFVARSLETMARLRELRPGPVVVHEGPESFGEALRRIDAVLCPPAGSPHQEEWIAASIEASAPERRRQRPGAGFMGSPSGERQADGPDQVWNDRARELEAARAAFEVLTTG